jgi:hypothetical protein
MDEIKKFHLDLSLFLIIISIHDNFTLVYDMYFQYSQGQLFQSLK